MEKNKKYNILFGLIYLVIIILSIYILFNAMKDSGEKTAKFCDEKYGINNWYFKDITGTQEAKESVGRFYIGQVWGCRSYQEQKGGLNSSQP